jgi:hypothetical protein
MFDCILLDYMGVEFPFVVALFALANRSYIWTRRAEYSHHLDAIQSPRNCQKLTKLLD